MSPAEQMKAAENFTSLVRSLDAGTRAVILGQILALQSEENQRLQRHHEPHQLFRAQGGVAVLQKLLESFK